MNTVHLIGNIGSDIESNTFASGTVSKFSMATSERWRDKDGNKQEKTSWHNIVSWGGLADVAAKFLKKGSKVYVSGRIEYDSWQKEDGTKGYRTNIVIDKLEMLDKKTEGDLPF